LKSKNKPIIGITMGDPKGIGPEVIRKALAAPAIRRICRPVIFGDAVFFDWKKAKPLSPEECGQLSGFYIEQAFHAVSRRQIDAIVTAPISKENLQKAGYRYPGHTEFLAALAGVRHVRMMMAGPRLKVALVTIHEPLKKISSLLSVPLILKTIEITHRSLKERFRIKRPRIALAALNPHAGEAGIFGDEEKKIIAPAVERAKREKIIASGPYPPDTVFYRAAKGEFDAVVAMYHDQGLIPLKLLHFEEAVNITLGLPFIRTSVDHGTAFDIAGKGIANPASMMAAIKMAVEMVQK
jgi:4-hydroxythreonine-4-phosphate dehydrogenase